MGRKIYNYDINLAKKNRCYIGVGGIILKGFIACLILVGFIVLGSYLDEHFNTNSIYTIASIVVWFILLIIGIVYNKKKVTARLTSLIEDNGKLYILTNRKDGSGTMITSNLADDAIDMVAGENSMLGDTVSSAGTIIGFFKLNSSFKDMENEEKVNSFFELANRNIMFKKIRIEKINNVIEKSKSYKLNCDYTNAKNNKLHKNKKIVIYKVYDNLENLLK